MISGKDIDEILKAVRAQWPGATERSVAFAALCSIYSDKQLAFRAIYGRDKDGVDGFYDSKYIRPIREELKRRGIVSSGRHDNVVSVNDISREENKAALIQMIGEVQRAVDCGDIERDKGLKMIADIRFKLNDKFEMEDGGLVGKRIIVVPQKHDAVCPHTHKECSMMPSKEACKEFYGLVEGS